MCQRKSWGQKEDQFLSEMQNNNQQLPERDRMPWSQIAQALNKQFEANRSGKQCRQRWHNQLKPEIADSKNRPWEKQEEEKLFKSQQKNGNKWAAIAAQLPGRTDNNIKNHFYSTIRKALRKVNNYLSQHKKEPRFKNIKQFQKQTLNKIIAVADKKYERKVEVKECKDDTEEQARIIETMLIKIEHCGMVIGQEQNEFVANIIGKIQEFNRNCKRRKGRKKESEPEEIEEQLQDIQHQIEFQVVDQPKTELKRPRKYQQEIFSKAQKVKEEYILTNCSNFISSTNVVTSSNFSREKQCLYTIPCQPQFARFTDLTEKEECLEDNEINFEQFEKKGMIYQASGEEVNCKSSNDLLSNSGPFANQEMPELSHRMDSDMFLSTNLFRQTDSQETHKTIKCHQNSSFPSKHLDLLNANFMEKSQGYNPTPMQCLIRRKSSTIKEEMNDND